MRAERENLFGLLEPLLSHVEKPSRYLDHGGNVIVETDPQLSSLIDYRFKHHFKADKGTHGLGARRHGRDGDDLVLRVPLGTVVRELDPETQAPVFEIADLTQPGERVIVAPGGIGGRGNIHFATSVRRAPAFAEKGEPAIEHWIELEMKLMPVSSLELARVAAIAADSKKAADILLLDLTGQTDVCDYFLICTGANGRM